MYMSYYHDYTWGQTACRASLRRGGRGPGAWTWGKLRIPSHQQAGGKREILMGFTRLKMSLFFQCRNNSPRIQVTQVGEQTSPTKTAG